VQLATLLEALARDSTWELSVILLNEGRLAYEIRKLGIPVTVISEKRHNSVGLFTGIATYLRRHRPDIIHTHKYKDNVLGVTAAAAMGVPGVVRVIHGMTEPFRGIAYVKMMGYELVDRLVTWARVNKVIAVSRDIEVAVRKIYGDRKVVQIHNGVNLEKVIASQDRETVRRGIGIRPHDHMIGTVGRLTPVKGHDVLLRAMSSIAKTMKNVKLLIVGDGPLMPALKKLVHALAIENQVILAGQRHDVYDLVNCLDVFALPSLHEGIPMVLLEALALKRPVVASRVGGIPEVVKHKVSGLLVTAGNVEELEQGIVSLLTDRSCAMGLGQAGREWVEQEFSATVMARRTAYLYSSMILR
jgi:glycosyltransferase involved in cell wall biosynthesis